MPDLFLKRTSRTELRLGHPPASTNLCFEVDGAPATFEQTSDELVIDFLDAVSRATVDDVLAQEYLTIKYTIQTSAPPPRPRTPQPAIPVFRSHLLATDPVRPYR